MWLEWYWEFLWMWALRGYLSLSKVWWEVFLPRRSGRLQIIATASSLGNVALHRDSTTLFITFGSTPSAGSLSGEATTAGHDLFPDTAQFDGGGTQAATPTPSNKIAPRPTGHPFWTLLEQCYLITSSISLSTVYASMNGLNG